MDDIEVSKEFKGKKKRGLLAWLEDPEKARLLFFATLFHNNGRGPGGPGPGIGF